MAEDIALWLDSLGQYEQAFADNGILEGARSSGHCLTFESARIGRNLQRTRSFDDTKR